MDLARINKVYEKLNSRFADGSYMNTPITRKAIKLTLEKELGHDIQVKCDSENNPPNVIDNQILICRVSWCEGKSSTWKYADLELGKEILGDNII